MAAPFMSAIWDALIARATDHRVVDGAIRHVDDNDARVSALGALSESYEELGHVVVILSKARSLQETRVVLKLYATGWATLSDLVAGLINEVLDLGYAEQ